MGLMRRLVLGGLDLTDYPFSVEFGEDHGAPENTYDTLVSMLADGELMSSDRVRNREISLTVLVEGPTLADLARNEALLIAECEKPRSTLTIDPGDTYAASSVFDIFRVQARLQYDADLEQANFRRYELTIPALPYPHTEELTVTPAVVSGGVGGLPLYTLVDNGSSLTNWAQVGSGYTLSVVSGRIRATRSAASVINYRVRKTASVAVASTSPFLVVDVAVSNAVLTGVRGLGSTYANPELVQDLGSGVTRHFLQLDPTIPGTTVTDVDLFFTGTVPVPASSHYVEIDQVQFADSLPYAGTTRQKAMSLVPGGSVRTQGSVSVSHASNALGKTIVYTHPSGTGYSPPLRPWRVSSEAVTSDSSLISGARNATGPTGTIYSIPAANLPTGRAEIWAWLRYTGGAALPFSPTFTYAFVPKMGSVELEHVNRTVTLTFPAVNTWYLFCLGAATIPPVNIGPAGLMQFHFVGASDLEVDEAYMFATDEGRLTVVDCGTGTLAAGGPSNRLWIDAPSQDNDGRGGLYRGNAADRSDAWHAGSLAQPWQTHNFAPEGTSVFVVTPNTLDAATSLEHYKRFHTHVTDT